MNDAALAGTLLLELVVLLLACRAVGWIAARCRQPYVIAEMIAGFVLGPSVFGLFSPDLQERLFPRESIGALFVLSQIGLVLYMFCVGLGFRANLLARYGRVAVAVSAAGIIVPFTLGAALATALLQRHGLFAPGVTNLHAMLFMGAAMSITAFPMLARIISERGISGTAIGSLALAAGAINDATAWIILAIVLSLFNGNGLLAAAAVGGAIAYAAALFVARPLFRRLAAHVERQQELTPAVLTIVVCVLALGSWFTERTGMHSVFGAFLLGAVVPRGLLTDMLRRAIEPLTTALLLPLFFMYSGLNTEVSLVNSAALWAITGLIFLSACVGKGVACWAAARLGGAGARDALGLAALMNCRGMVELVLLNIGLQRGLITPTLFTMMVLMAIATTVMTGPLFGYVWQRSPERAINPALAADILS